MLCCVSGPSSNRFFGVFFNLFREYLSSLYSFQFLIYLLIRLNISPVVISCIIVGRKKGRGSHHSRTPTSTADLLTLPTREGLTYAEAQKMVEFEVDGRVTRVSIFDPLPLISKEEFEATYGSSNDSVSSFMR